MLELCARIGDALLGAACARSPHVQRLRKLRALLAPLSKLRVPLGVLAFEALARLLHVPQLGFVARHLRVRCR